MIIIKYFYLDFWSYKYYYLFLCKLSWDFERKSKCNNISKIWKIMFQMFNAKGRHFLDILDDDLHPIESLYTKGGLWIKYFRYSNFLCAWDIRAIINYTSIKEYCLCFFLNKDFSCLYGIYLIESRCHILYKCRRFNNYWNLRQNTIGHFVSFLEFNKNMFSFGESIT